LAWAEWDSVQRVGLKKEYRIGISPEIYGWDVLFGVYLERFQAQVWCPNKVYFQHLQKCLEYL